MGLKEKDLHGRVHSEARMEKVGDKRCHKTEKVGMNDTMRLVKDCPLFIYELISA